MFFARFFQIYLVISKKSRTFAAACEEMSSGHRDVAQSGSATVWGTGGRKFESCHPDEESARALFFVPKQIECKGTAFF